MPRCLIVDGREGRLRQARSQAERAGWAGIGILGRLGYLLALADPPLEHG